MDGLEDRCDGQNANLWSNVAFHCCWLNRIWMTDSYLVVLLAFGFGLVLEHVEFCQLFLYMEPMELKIT